MLTAMVMFVVIFVSTSSALGQWPQWGGPDRNFTVETKALADRWPDEGPKRVWRRELGDGYSSIVVDGNVIYTMYRPGGKTESEYAVALDAATGRTIWEYESPSALPPNTEYATGPNSTPLISGNHVYMIGTNLVLRCFRKATGDVVWTRDLAEEFGTPLYSYGYACSPLAHDDKVILAVGGRGDAGTVLMAFDHETGRTAWKTRPLPRTANQRCEYSSAIAINFAGEDQIVYSSNEQLAAFRPATGGLLWSHPCASQSGRNISTPVFNGKDLIFCSSAYDSGSRVVRLTHGENGTVPQEAWFHRRMKLHFGSAVVVGDTVYGSSGDKGPAFFMAADLATGEILWRERRFKKATCLHADGKLIILDEDGQLVLAVPSREGLTVLSTARVAEHQSWTPPTLAGSMLYIRDRKHIMAFDLR